MTEVWLRLGVCAFAPYAIMQLLSVLATGSGFLIGDIGLLRIIAWPFMSLAVFLWMVLSE